MFNKYFWLGLLIVGSSLQAMDKKGSGEEKKSRPALKREHRLARLQRKQDARRQLDELQAVKEILDLEREEEQEEADGEEIDGDYLDLLDDGESSEDSDGKTAQDRDAESLVEYMREHSQDK